MTKCLPECPYVVALAYEGLCTFEFAVAVEIFGLPRPEMGPAWYDFAVAGLEPGPLQATGGIRMMTDGGMDLFDRADIIIIPGWRGKDTPVPARLCLALQTAHQRGCRIVSICSGVFVLAAAGLLDGRKATTHWRYASELQQRYPQIQVNENVLYIDEGSVLTSAGSAAGIDLCLHIVRQDFGASAANTVARRLVIPPHRDGGQAQYSHQPLARPHEKHRLNAVFDALNQHLASPHSVASLARIAGMSERTFLRRFQEATGTTPARWLLQQRLQYAKTLLEESELTIEQIACDAGFGSADVLRQHFRKYLQVSPGEYRKTFTTRSKLFHIA